MNHYPEDTEPSDNTLYKTKHTRSSILSYRVGLDPIATSYLVDWIEKNLQHSWLDPIYLHNTSQEEIPQ